MSKEHVWPKWVRHLLPDGADDVAHAYSFEDADRGEFLRREGEPPYAVEVREVCRPCNEGWMDRAEVAVRPIAERMMAGPTAITAEEQTQLAFWGVMKGLVANRALRSSGSALPPASDFTDVWSAREMGVTPDGFLVHMAKSAWSANQAPAVFFRLTGISRGNLEKRDEFDGYALTYSMLDLVILVIRVFGAEPSGVVPFDDQKSAPFSLESAPYRQLASVGPPLARLRRRD